MSTSPNVIQDVRKRDDKARTFTPPDNTIELAKDDWEKLYELKRSTDLLKSNPNKKFSLDGIKRPEDLERDKILKSINQYKKMDLRDIKGLIDRINLKVTEKDNIVDLGNNKEVYFRDLNDFLHDIMDGKINDFNKKIEYEKRLKNTKKQLANKTKFSEFIKLYEQFITTLKRILFSDKKSLDRGLTISSLPILLSKIYTNNSSKELINNIEQLIKNLYDNKQIIKQVYNILNKNNTFLKNFIKNDS